MAIVYLYDAQAETFVEDFCRRADAQEVDRLRVSDTDALDAVISSTQVHLLVSGSLELIRRVVSFAWEQGISMGIVPLPEQTRLKKALALPGDPRALFETVTRPAEHPVDLLLCDDIPVIEEVRIGENALLKEYEFETPLARWSDRVRRFIRRWQTKTHLRHHRFTLTTDKDETLTLSAVGLIALHHNNHSWIGQTLRRQLSATDGQLALIALAPTSLFEFFVAYPIRMAWRRWRQESALPRSWGYLKSARITLDTPQPLEAVIDDTRTVRTPLTLRIESAALRLSAGEAFGCSQETPKNTRNTIRLSGVPRDEERMRIFEQGLPLFAHASTEEYAALFGTLREETQLSWTFAILLVLSTVLATLGLFINSASVIIGAMLLAPLMQPIVGLSMGVLRRDTGLLLSGARSIAVGVGLVLASATVLAWVTPIHTIGSEMAARLSPTILDLMVAITSGVAAAYAKNTPRISGSLVGVAIAVALVPPLSVAGIGIGWGSWTVCANALLLFVTNLVGIVLAAALTFFFLGFSPIRIARAGIAIWAAVALIVAVPLYRSFEQMRLRAQIRQTLSQLHFAYRGHRFALERVEYLPRGEQALVRCEVIADGALDAQDRAYLQEMIHQVVGRPVETIVTVRYRLSPAH